MHLIGGERQVSAEPQSAQHFHPQWCSDLKLLGAPSLFPLDSLARTPLPLFITFPDADGRVTESHGDRRAQRAVIRVVGFHLLVFADGKRLPIAAQGLRCAEQLTTRGPRSEGRRGG